MNYTKLEYFFYGKLGRDEFKKLPFGAERAAAAFAVPASILSLGVMGVVRLLRHSPYHEDLLRWGIIFGYGVILSVLWILLYWHLKKEKTTRS
ncbi:MAG TPA: hypothetical protein O0Y06_07590 [Methanocorpusculum sp.]|nr:hypothetical protein [Methanocorpusculum sp.]HJK80748.1 hypothetical protein [Methanocorpusculum sp.]